MNKLLLLVLMVLLLSCQNGNTQSQKRTYTEAELQQAIQKAKEDQKTLDDATAVVESAARATMEPPKTEITPAPRTYYVFAVIIGSFSRPTIPPYTDYYAYTSEIFELSHKPTRDEEYRMLDKLNEGKIAKDRDLHYDFKTHERKVYSFTSYADASEKRREVSSQGIK